MKERLNTSPIPHLERHVIQVINHEQRAISIDHQ